MEVTFFTPSRRRHRFRHRKSQETRCLNWESFRVLYAIAFAVAAAAASVVSSSFAVVATVWMLE